MNLGKQIHALLKSQKEVYVEGLGTFKRIHTSSSFDAKQHVYLPPISFISFEATGTQGFDFISYIQQAEQIERPAAEDLVRQRVIEVIHGVRQSGQITLDSLGHLISYGQALVFKPLDLTGFNFKPIAELKGLQAESAVAIPVSEPLQEHAAIAEQDEIPVEKEKPEPVAMVAESTVTEEVYEETATAKGNSSFVFGLIAVLAILALGGVYFYKAYYSADQSSVTQQPQVSIPIAPIIDTPAVADTTDSLSQQVDVDTVQTEVVSEDAPISKKVMPFTIIIGQHKSLAQADMEVEEFHKKGFKHVKLLTSKSTSAWKQVIWDTYETAAERDSALQYVKKHINKDAMPHLIK